MHEMEKQLHDAEIEVEFQDQTEETLYRLVMLGESARDFFDSDVGRYVIGAARMDLEVIDQKLRVVSPWRRRKILKLQMEYKAVQDGIRWIAEVIQQAEDAETQLNQYRE